jgi:Glycine zipper
MVFAKRGLNMNTVLPSKKSTTMKRILSVVTIAAVMAASCNSVPTTAGMSTTQTPVADTAGLAQYKAWKAQNELAVVNQSTQTSSTAPATRTVVKYVPVRSYSSSGSMSSSSSNTARASQKKGWSKSAKGAVIGGVAGAAGGAIINKKNRGLGAVIGGVIGAAGGYGIGRGMDKRDGRF